MSLLCDREATAWERKRPNNGVDALKRQVAFLEGHLNRWFPALARAVTRRRSSEVLCEKCGGPVAPDDMIKKITALLGSDPTVSTITRFCLSCRGVTLSGQEYGEKNLE